MADPCSVTDAKIDDLHDDVKLIKELLTGNGTPSKGVIVRLDRLEQWRKFLVFIITTVFVGGVATLWSWVKFKGRMG